MQLVLLRHGPAIDRSDPDCPPDPERWLTKAGVRRSRAALRGLAPWLPRPVRLRASPWRRARETAALLAAALEEHGADAEVVDEPGLIPGAPTDATLARLLAAAASADDASTRQSPPPAGSSRDEPPTDGCVVAVGHAPLLDELLLAALGGPHPALAPLEKCGAACVAEPGTSSARLLWLLPPRVLRALGEAR